MNFKRMTLLSLCLVMGYVLGNSSEEERWNFVRKKLVDEPEMTRLGWVNKNLSIAIPAVAALPGFVGFCCSTVCLSKEKEKEDPDFENIIGGIGGAFLSLVVMGGGPAISILVMNYLKKNVNYRAINDYALYFDEYKERTPAALYEKFQKLCIKCKESDSSNKYFDKEAITLIEEIIKLCREQFDGLKNKESK